MFANFQPKRHLNFENQSCNIKERRYDLITIIMREKFTIK